MTRKIIPKHGEERDFPFKQELYTLLDSLVANSYMQQMQITNKQTFKHVQHFIRSNVGATNPNECLKDRTRSSQRSILPRKTTSVS